MTLDNYDKLRALKKINSYINERIEQLAEKNEVELIYGDNIFINDNGETTYQILRLDKDYSTGIIVNNEFKRIICVKGLLNINFPEHDDHALVHSPNTILIPPKTQHIISCLDNCEIIIVYKPNSTITRYKIIEENSIYKKKKN